MDQVIGYPWSIFHFTSIIKFLIVGVVNWVLAGSAYDWYKERVGVLDHEQMIKEVNLIQGGVLDFGFISFRTTFEIIDKGPNQCTVKSTVMYDIKHQFSANESMATVDDLGTVARAVEQYIGKKSAGSGFVSLPNSNGNGLPGWEVHS